VKECVFVNSVLKIQCHVVKNTLIQTAFTADIHIDIHGIDCFFGDFAHWDIHLKLSILFSSQLFMKF